MDNVGGVMERAVYTTVCVTIESTFSQHPAVICIRSVNEKY